jgi:hypothetical protein
MTKYIVHCDYEVLYVGEIELPVEVIESIKPDSEIEDEEIIDFICEGEALETWQEIKRFLNYRGYEVSSK